MTVERRTETRQTVNRRVHLGRRVHQRVRLEHLEERGLHPFRRPAADRHPVTLKFTVIMDDLGSSRVGRGGSQHPRHLDHPVGTGGLHLFSAYSRQMIERILVRR